MEEVYNCTKNRLRDGKVALGVGVQFIRSVQIARLAASSGYHYVLIDLQHSTIGVDAAADICVAALDAGITPMVRVPSIGDPMATRLLDGGAQGISFPDVSTAEEARAAVRQCKFPPLGTRSFAASASATQLGWRKMSIEQATKALNDSTLLTVTIETAEGLANVEAIAAVPGVDIIAVGTKDLTLSMGIPGEYDSPQVFDAYARILAAAKRNGIAVRLGGVEDLARTKKNVEVSGARLVTLCQDLSLLLNGMRGKMTDFQGAVDPNLAL